jgi:hypothetical protein
VSRIAVLLVLTGVPCSRAAAQNLDAPQATAIAPRPLITEAVDESRLTTLKGNVHPLARPQFDLGTAPASLPMERMLLVLKRSVDQETALRKLLDDQQDKKSPSYHKWVSPEDFGRQFGPTDADMQTITAWLQSHGFQVNTTKGRTVLEFSGSASQVQEAFHTTIHKYVVSGEQHWANANDPQIPAALAPAVAGVLTLHNFIKKPTLHFTGEPVPAQLVRGKKPQVTFPSQNGQPAMNALAPQDFATIYNIAPLYASNITASGNTIGVIGRSNLFNNGQDVQDFRNVVGSGIGPGIPGIGVVITDLNGPDPGDLGGGEEAEATLDASWAGALAPDAVVYFVVSATTNTTDGIDLSESYIIENNLADVMTESFSACELFATDAQLAGATAMAEQAAAQGITYIISTGDDGATGCDDPNVAPASYPPSVNFLASTAFNVAVGGTMFNENGSPNKYWGSTPPISETALSYIPENVWNESSLTNGLWSSSGGASAGNLLSGFGTTGGVPKPSWQSGLSSIPNDNVRDLPDVSLTAAGHDPYLLCLEGSCEPNSQGELFVYFISGTSASAPSFAGIMALIDQKTGTAQWTRGGLANYYLYRLAAMQSSYPAQCDGSNTSTPPATSCVFNDVTVGSNVVPGEQGTQYQAGVGYDLTTGLGSMNVNNLADQWSTATFNPTTTSLTLNNGAVINVVHGQPLPISVNVSPNSGGGTPTGNVEMVLYPTESVTQSDELSLGLLPLNAGVFNGSIYTIPGSTIGSVFAHYGGDATYAPSNSTSVSVAVMPEPSTLSLSMLAYDATGNPLSGAPWPFGSLVYVRADVAGQSGYGIPTGSVTFSDTFGAIPGGSTFGLNSQGNTANPNGVFNFDAGTHTISASYTGDPSFNASSSTQSQTFTISPGFFVAIPSAGSVVVVTAPGGSGQTSASLSYSTGFLGTITFACSGLPSGATCVFSPASLSVGGVGSTTSTNLTVKTTAATAQAFPEKRLFWPAQFVFCVGLVVSMLTLSRRPRKASGASLLLLLGLLVLLPNCGGGNNNSGGNQNPPPNPGTPAGTYGVTVTASAGSTVGSTGFTLVVQ